MTRAEAAFLFVLLLAWDILDDQYMGCLLDGEDHRELAAQIDELEAELSEAGIDNPAEVLAEMRERGLA